MGGEMTPRETWIWRKPISSFATYCLWGGFGAVACERIAPTHIERFALLLFLLSMAALCIRVRDLHDVFVKKEKA